MESDYSLITPMKERRPEMKAIEQGWPISDEQRERIVEHLTAIATGKAGDASPRDRIRATECLAKLDALNIQREQADRSKRVDVAILPPAYEQMSNLLARNSRRQRNPGSIRGPISPTAGCLQAIRREGSGGTKGERKLCPSDVSFVTKPHFVATVSIDNSGY